MFSKLDSDSTLFHDGEDDPPRADIIDDNLTSSNKKLANTLKSNLESYCNDCYFVKCNNQGTTFGWHYEWKNSFLLEIFELSIFCLIF